MSVSSHHRCRSAAFQIPGAVGAIIIFLFSLTVNAVEIIADNYNATGSGSGFAPGAGVNSGINPPTTRLAGTAAANLRYIQTGTKTNTAFVINSNKVQIASAANPGRFVLSADGSSSFDFGPALGVATANATNPVVYNLSIAIDNSSSGSQRCSFALGTAEGDATTWDFGIQVYRANSADDFYTIGKRIDTGSSGLESDLNAPIVSLTPNTFGNEINLLIRVTDTGSETTAFNSRLQLSLNNGNSWIYDTLSDPDLPNGWRLNGVGRHIMWDIAPGAGPVTFDNFSLNLNPPLSNINTSGVFRVMTYNIHSGSGPDGKVNTQRIADFIVQQNVDLVGLNEVARFMPRSDGRDIIAELSQETGMTYVFSNNDTALTGNDQFGNAILSKFPVLFRDHRLLPNVSPNEQRGWLKAIVDVNGKFVSFWVTHLDFHNDDSERLMCVSDFNDWIDDEIFPVFFCGDFNETPDKTVHSRMENKWDDVWLLAGDGGLGRTSPCPPPLATRIDYIWKAQGAAVAPTNAFVGYSVEGSDHYPVVTDFILTNFTNHSAGFFFPFDQGAGTKITDTMAGLTGKFGTNAPVWSPDSPTGLANDYSLYFDGTKKLLVTDTNQVIGTNGLNGDYTLQAWVKLPLDYAPAQRAVLFQYERKPGFSISINTNRTLHTTTFKIKDIPSAASVPNDGKWHHVAVVHTDGANMKFYIDAVLAATVPYTNGPGFRVTNTISLGGASDDANPFTGAMDRICFDQKALTPSELDFPAVPRLSIRKSGSNLMVAWPVSKSPYKLQMTDRLQNATWTDVPSQLQGPEFQASVTPTNSAKFFKLAR
jgi:endonuclease/exonuclease/phosphatase family metal-dependent hydrolase